MAVDADKILYKFQFNLDTSKQFTKQTKWRWKVHFVLVHLSKCTVRV